MDGLHDTDVIRTLGQVFEIHPLVLEDILFALLVKLGDAVEALEDQITDDPNREIMREIHLQAQEVDLTYSSWLKPGDAGLQAKGACE